MGPVYPVFARSGDDKQTIRRLVLQATRAISLVSIFLSVPIFVFSKEFTHLFFGEQFHEAAPAVGILALTMIPLGMTWVFGSLVSALGRQSKANILICLVTIMNLLLHYVLIPMFGVLGAAVTTLATECAMVLACVWIVREFFDIAEFSTLLLKALLPGFLVFGAKEIGLLQGEFSIELPLLLATMLGIFYFLRLVTLSDIKKLAGKQ
jgi:O-antigen/teichoic acid export membrane protein